MQVFSYTNRGGNLNSGLLFKDGTSKPSFLIDFADGLQSSSATIASAACTAVDEDNQTVTSECVSSSGTVSGTTVRVDLLTFGSSGTGAATNGIRRRIRTTATLSAGGPIVFDVFALVQNETYDPDDDA